MTMRAGRNYECSNTAHHVASVDAHCIVNTTHVIQVRIYGESQSESEENEPDSKLPYRYNEQQYGIGSL